LPVETDLKHRFHGGDHGESWREGQDRVQTLVQKNVELRKKLTIFMRTLQRMQRQRHSWLIWVTILCVMMVSAWGVMRWMTRPLDVTVVESVPGMDGRPVGPVAATESVRIGSIFAKGNGTPSSLPGVWPAFRGAAGLNVAEPSERLAERWATSGPARVWSVDLGEGHAGPAVWGGRVYLLDYDETRRADVLKCLSLDDGELIWERGYPVHIKRNHGFSRTVPAIGEGAVVSIGPRCHVMCVDAVTGDLRWGVDMVKEFGAQEPDWYTGQCPLIDQGVVVLAPCGTNVLLMGLDCRDGKMVWSTPSPGMWKMSHASVVRATIAGKRMYVYAAINGMAGVSAEESDRGVLLWKTEEWSPSVIVPCPVVLENGRIFVTAGYGGGAMTFTVTRDGDRFDVTAVKRYAARDGFASEQQTPVVYGGRLFGVLPKDAGPDRNQFVCADSDGKILWTSGKDARFGLGPVMVVGDRFLVMGDDGTLTMARASTTGWQRMAQAKVLEGHDAWGPMALAGKRLLARDSKRMVCLDLGE
jgi:outer membrane protein assembly factor BamB